MCDWTEAEISGISEEDFPVRCDRCGRLLTGLGDSGRCPQCATAFVRRQRLWETHGAEAFATPPITETEQPDRGFITVTLTVVGMTLLLPAILLAWDVVFGTFDLCFGLFAWLSVVSAIAWLVFVRHGRSNPPEPPNDGSGPPP